MAWETNRPQPADDVPLRKLLSREELRELLSPMSGQSHAGGDEPDISVLLLTESAADVESIAAYLKIRGISVLPAANRYAAIDQFRRRSFLRVVCTLEALGGETPLFLRRIRESSPQAQFAFICGEGAADSEAARLVLREGPVVERPLETAALDRLFPELVVSLRNHGDEETTAGIPAQPPLSGGAAAITSVTASTPVPHGIPPAAFSGGGRQSPDPVLGICALLETKIQGGAVREALELWAKKDAAVLGLVRAERGGQPGELTLKSVSHSDNDAMRILSDAVALFSIPEAQAVQPAGRFLVFPEPRHADPQAPAAPAVDSLLALCAREAPALSPWESCRRFEEVIQLLQRLQAAGSAPAPQSGAGAGGPSSAVSPRQESNEVRARLLEYLEARMRSCERHNFRLGLLLAEVAAPADLVEAFRQLRKVLRGCDWLQAEGKSIYVVLDQPERGWQASLGRRLKIANDTLRVRMVGAVWNPLGEDAQGLLQRMEKALALGPPGPLLELLDSSS